MEDLINIGKIGKPHGLKGEVKVFVDKQFLEDFLETGVVFLEKAGATLPYFLERVRSGNHIILKLEDVDTPESAKEIQGATLQMKAEALSEPEEQENPEGLTYFELKGFDIWDEAVGKVGTIEEIVSYPQQELAELTHNGKLLLLPLNDELILSVDFDAKKVVMDLPDGLLNL